MNILKSNKFYVYLSKAIEIQLNSVIHILFKLHFIEQTSDSFYFP